MSDLATGARRLPLHHITIRVGWHDAGWTGTIRADSREKRGEAPAF